jgi:CHAD domain-containing protein
MENRATIEQWAQETLHAQIESAAGALREHCSKPKSVKRLHSARKELARLRAALADLSAIAGVAPEFLERVHELHRRAGKVRDADVLLERVRSYSDAGGADDNDVTCIEVILRKRRNRARRKLRSAINATAPELRP